jgi:hypothetical protein
MSKTPYEIRLDVLEMAQKLLQDQYYSQASVLADYSSRIPPSNKKEYDTMVSNYAPKPITTEDIVTKANELYAFVNDNTASSSALRGYSTSANTSISGNGQKTLLTENKPRRK